MGNKTTIDNTRESRAIVSLGSNIEPRKAHLEEALRLLAALPGTRLVSASSVIETEPVDVPEEFRDMAFLNQAAVFATTLDAFGFSRAMHRIEDEMGRVRTVRNGPRTIDIDLIDFDGLRIDTPELVLPHPRALSREFVMKPLAELGVATGTALYGIISPMRKLKLGVLGSGSGSNMQSIVDAIDAGTLDAEVAIVMADFPDAKILDRARKHGIPCQYLDCSPWKTKLEGRAEDECIDILRKHEVDVVVLAGFMRIVKPKLLAAFPNRVLNIHPALLPAFPGVHSWTQALDYGCKVAGVTVHFVDAGTDSGPIIVQRAVPVLEDDTPETLHARIQVQEHEAYPEALRIIASGKYKIEGRRVRIG